MALQIRRGTDAQRQLQRFEAGELIYTTDYKDLFVGDGSSNLGGIRIAPVKSVNGIEGSLADGAVTLTTDQVDEGSTNLYYNSQQARIDAGAALTGGNVGNTGITFTYHSNTDTITAVVTAGGYELPTAAPTELGGVKISQGGLQIDGAGLLSVITPVSSGVAGHLSYYTGTNAVGDAGTGLKWSTTNLNFPAQGGEFTVDGLCNLRRVVVKDDLEFGGLYIATQNNGDGDYDLLTLYSSHAETTPSAMRMFRTRGTVASPAAVNSTDNLFDMQFVGSTGAGAGIAAQIRAKVAGTVSAGVVPGSIILSTADATGTLVDSITVKATDVTFATRATFPDGTAGDPSIAFTTDGGIDTGFSHPGDGIIVVSSNATEVARFDGGGIRSSGFIKVADVAGTLPSPAEAGMIVLDGSTFKGYNGSTWVTLG